MFDHLYINASAVLAICLLSHLVSYEHAQSSQCALVLNLLTACMHAM
jgi:hypothetical protein